MKKSVDSSKRLTGRQRALVAGIVLALACSGVVSAQAPSWPHLRDALDAHIFPQLAPNRPAALRAPPVTRAGRHVLVTSCADDGPGSLRAAVAAAQDYDNIDLSTLACSTITLSSGALVVPVDNLTLSGPGVGHLAIDGGGQDRVLVDGHGGELRISDLTIQNGETHVDGLGVTGGACIADAGYLTLVRSVVRDCFARAEGVYGGGIYTGVLTMIESTITGSTAYGQLANTGTAASGGGAYAVYAYLTDSRISGNISSHRADPPREHYDIGGGLMIGRGGVIVRSTIDHNVAGDRGGGIFNIGDLVIDNSTVSANSGASELGGGVFMRIPAVLTMTSSTVSGNQAADGGGITLSPRGGTLQSTIVFGNTATAGASDLGASSVQTLAGDHNLIGGAGPNLTLPGDTLHSDPLLLPLRTNGGVTPTQALANGSPAIDAGSNPANATVDQRGAGYPRVRGAAADIGAVEWAAAAPSLPVPVLSPWAALWLTLGLGVIALGKRTSVARSP